MRKLARKRFTLGYPPRKKTELSIIDAINWEWIIYCANNCSDDIVIVSRDKDFGEHYQNESMLNDWLVQEFKERVSRRRSITLTTRLSEAFRLASIQVSQEEEESEEVLLKRLYLDAEAQKKLDLSLKYLNETMVDTLAPTIESFNILRERLAKFGNYYTDSSGRDYSSQPDQDSE